MKKAELKARRPVVYHIMRQGRRHVAAASTLVLRPEGLRVELDPEVVGQRGIFLPIEAAKLRTLDEEGWIYGYADVVDRRGPTPRRRRMQLRPPRSPGRRASDKHMRHREAR